MRRAWLPVVVMVSAVAIGVAALHAQAPVRDALKLSTTGTALISGTVVSDEVTRPPLRRATISLSRTGVEDIRYSVTDDRGRFQFAELPSGTYTLGASKAAYISTSYGALQPGMPGTSISVTDGQRFVANPMPLVRGAVIAGRILDRNNKPVAGSEVAATPISIVNGERRPRVVSAGLYGRATTNAHGEYRIYGLVSGDYLLSADTSSGQTARDILTAEMLRWARQPASTPAPAPARVYSYTRSLFPGTADAAAAAPIGLTRGEEKTGMDFALQYVPVVRVSGVVTGPDGLPAGNALLWRGVRSPDAIVGAANPVAARSAADGTFTFTNVAPGEWFVLASGGPVVIPNTSAVAEERGAVRTRMSQWGIADVTVSGRDVVDVAIRLGPGASLTGRVSFANPSQPAAPPPIDPTRVRLTLTALDPVNSQLGLPVATVNPDGTFTFEDIGPGRFQLGVFRTGPSQGIVDGWSVRSAMLGGRDLIDVPLDVRSGEDISGIAVTMSNQMASLSGTLVDAANRPTPQFYVFIFPVDRTQWTKGSRRILAARADVNGVYTISGLPAGEYYVCALTELDRAQQYEATYLEQLAPAGHKITLAEGEKKAQSLRVGG